MHKYNVMMHKYVMICLVPFMVDKRRGDWHSSRN